MGDKERNFFHSQYIIIVFYYLQKLTQKAFQNDSNISVIISEKLKMVLRFITEIRAFLHKIKGV